MSVISFLKKRTTIKTKEILLVYCVIILFNTAQYMFQFSIVRFLKQGLGPQLFLIGIFFAVANFIFIFFDIPLGVLQKYIKPRVFFLVATGLMFFADMIFVVAELNVYLALLAVFCYQLATEIFFVTITTTILRLSTPADYAQNVAQADAADNIGGILGFGIAGVVFVIDKYLKAHDAVVASFLAVLIGIVLFTLYEFFDHKHHNTLEQYILDKKLAQRVVGSVATVGNEIVAETQESSIPIPASPPVRERGALMKQIQGNFKSVFLDLKEILLGKGKAPIILWGVGIMVVTFLWYQTIMFFEPVLVKQIFNEGEGWIIDNVPRNLFESVMFIVALVVPTFFLEVPLGKIADQWGKEKMIITGTLFSGLALLILGFFPSAMLVFLVFLVVHCGYVMAYPSLVGVVDEQYKGVVAKRKKTEALAASSTAQPAAPEESSEGNSAAIIAIIVNLGQVLAGLLGGALTENFSFNMIFTIYGLFLVLIGGASVFFYKKWFAVKPMVSAAVPVQVEPTDHS